jgi:DNA-directed RNA polymerase subunit RPC12/RpoP
MASGSPRRVIPLFGARDSKASTLQDLLDQRAQPGELWHLEGNDGSVRCTACGHRCLIREGRRGICKVRFNRNRTLHVPRGYAAGVQVDPTEKKPFFHVLPGSMEIFRLARPAGFKTAFVSNGNATPEVLDYIRPWTDCYKIDLKAMQARAYRALGGVLEHVLDAMTMVHERGFWMEIVTLVVPGFNDAPDDLRRMADAVAAISPDVPWHVTAFHQDYKMTDPRNTTAEDLVRVCEVGRAAGLRYVYAGNLPGRVGRWENTWCPDCGELLVERFGYQILRQRVTAAGQCPSCGARIAGVWS